MGRLDNKVAIITGGCGGIGQAAAAKFISEGARVMLVDLDRSVLEEVVTKLGSGVARSMLQPLLSSLVGSTFISPTQELKERYPQLQIMTNTFSTA